LIGDREITDLVDLPVMGDPQVLAIIQIASSLIPPAYNSGSILCPLLMALSVKLSIQHGNTVTSAFSYANYGFLLCNLLQDVDTGIKFGQLSLQIIAKFDAQAIAIKPEVLLVLGGFVLHRKSHIQDTLPLLQEGYVTSLEVGSIKFAGYHARTFCNAAFWCNQPLITLEQNTRAYYNGLIQLNQAGLANHCRLSWQSALNLLGFGKHPCILSGEAVQETEILPQLMSDNDVGELCVFHSYKLMLCFLFGEMKQAQNHTIECSRYLTAAKGLVYEPAFYFYDSLIALASVNLPTEPASEIFQRVEQNQTQLQNWAQYAPMNYQHKVDLVEAEKCRVSGQTAPAIELYDKAIALAKANEYIQEEALANELAAKFYLNWGKQRIAGEYMTNAYYGYSRWGAKAKIADLEKRYPQLLAPILQQTQSHLSTQETILAWGTVTSVSSPTASSSPTDILDLKTILKVSHTISSEIELEKLLSSLLRIVIENAGADKCVLMLLRDERLLIKGSIIQGQEPVVLQRIPVEDSQDIPHKLIYKVKHNHQTVVLLNATADPTLANDPYIARQQPKSILCSPILYQGKLRGILYLENNLATGAFTSDGVELLNLLCTQAAISLENARLYERSLENAQQLEQALQNLQQTQLQMIQSEKMSALGNLVAGVAHEMNNPLGFIAASLKQAKPTFTDVAEHLKLYQESFPNKSEAIIDHESEIDLEYTLEDLPKMIDSMTMACDRLKNISTSLRTFSRADRDYKVLFNIHQGIDSTILILKHRLKANEQRPAIEVFTNYSNLPLIECFPGQLNQVFMNILSNAIDALDESNHGRSFEEIKANPNCIKITTSVANNLVKIAIADNGRGMSESVKSQIFDHLFTTKAVGKGTGLGLAIARQIVEETHQGKLSCNSVLGEGTEFIIEVPV
jgi:signal transduction histidine kinase